MKKAIIILLVILSISALAGNKKVDKNKEAQAKAWVKNQQLEFIENKGQFTTTDGKPADNVLFKTSFGSCDIYITDKGLSYVFRKITNYEKSITNYELRITEEKNKLRKKVERDQDTNRKVFYYRLDMDLMGASITKDNIIKEEENKQGHYNYFYPHCPEGIYDVKGYGKITIKNIYKGIDWVIYTNKNNKEHPLKYDFIVHPEANYKDIKIKYLNAQSISLLDNDTKLKIKTIAGNIEEGNIFSYQNNKEEINSKYIINKDSTIAYAIGDYDKTKDLVIDPLVWATYYGGSGTDLAGSICIDNMNNVYITGCGGGGNFPLQQLTGAYWQGLSYSLDIYLLKFNSLGVRQWATYYGGTDDDYADLICSDSHGNIYIAGCTCSINLPVQQLTGAYWQPNNASGAFAKQTCYILKFNNQGVRKWATYYGGVGEEYSCSIKVDKNDNFFMIGRTVSYNFPIQQLIGAFWQSTFSGMGSSFILKFNSQGVRKWATYFGGDDDNLNSMCLDSLNNLYITGSSSTQNMPVHQLNGAFWQPTLIGNSNILILKFDTNGVITWCTYYGTNYEGGLEICLDSHENIYIAGITNSSNFPTQQLPGAYWQPNYSGGDDIVILKFNKLGVRQWATYYGGSFNDFNYSINADKDDNIYLTGETYSNDLPTKQMFGEYYQTTKTGISAAYILKFNNKGKNIWSTYYGGSVEATGVCSATDFFNNVYFIGQSNDSNLFTVDYGNGAYYADSLNYDYDEYILKIAPCNQKTTLLQSNRNNICSNDNGFIILKAIGGLGDTLKWYKGSCGLNYVGKDTILTIPSPTQTTTYYARWESSCDTSECDSIIIKVFPIATTTLNPVICQGGIVQVGLHTYNSSGIYKDTLSTYLGCDSIVITNLTVNPVKYTTLNPIICQGEIFKVGNHNYTSTGNYKDTLSTYLGCDSIVATNLIVNPKKLLTLNPIICIGEVFKVGIHTYNLTGIYSDSLSTYLGCDSIITTNLIVAPIPKVNLGNDTTLCSGYSLILDATNLYSTYQWQDNSTNPNYTVHNTGTYWVKVIIDSNCFANDTINIRYEDCVTPFGCIPNAFTPNGDGLNDVFKIETFAEFSEFYLYIYNRWGELLFVGHDKNKGWDGSYKGKTVPNGVYVYLVKGTIKDTNEQIKRTGSVTVVR